MSKNIFSSEKQTMLLYLLLPIVVIGSILLNKKKEKKMGFINLQEVVSNYDKAINTRIQFNNKISVIKNNLDTLLIEKKILGDKSNKNIDNKIKSLKAQIVNEIELRKQLVTDEVKENIKVYVDEKRLLNEYEFIIIVGDNDYVLFGNNKVNLTEKLIVGLNE